MSDQIYNETPILDDEGQTQEQVPEQVTNKQNCSCNSPLPEAGGVAWTELYAPNGAKINITARAETCEKAIEELVTVMASSMVKYELQPRMYGTPSVQQVQAPVATGQPVATTTQVAQAQIPAPVSGAVQVSQPEAQPAKGTPGTPFRCNYIEISFRQKDGKYDIKFFAGGRYPEMTAVKSMPDGIALLQGSGEVWDAARFNQPTQHQFPYVVEWVYGALNSNGRPYKNVMRIHP